MPPRAEGGGGCLHGKVFGITGELARRELQATLKAHGATVSAIIHKRVSFVLSTPDAVKYNTQKVRKALKHGIPLVSQEFIVACARARGVVDPTPFRVTASMGAAPTILAASRTAGRSARTPDDVVDTGGGNSEPGAKYTDVKAARDEELETLTGREGGVDAARNVSKGRRRRRGAEPEEEPAPSGTLGEGAAGVRAEGRCGGGDTNKKHNKMEGGETGANVVVADVVVADSCAGAGGAFLEPDAGDAPSIQIGDANEEKERRRNNTKGRKKRRRAVKL